jgi:membrane protein implicated in regulation of membrane protease activity
MTLVYVYLGCLVVGLVYAIIATLFGGHGDVGADVGGVDIGDVGGVDIGDFGGHGGLDFAHGEVGGAGDIASDTVAYGEVGFSPLSPIVIASFLASFGAFGIIGRMWIGLAAPASALFAVGCGLAVAAVMFTIVVKIFVASEGSSHAMLSDLMGREAEVITPIPERGIGEVAYIARGSRYTSSAKSRSGQEIGRGSAVRIVQIAGGVVYVEPLEQDPREDR